MVPIRILCDPTGSWLKYKNSDVNIFWLRLRLRWLVIINYNYMITASLTTMCMQRSASFSDTSISTFFYWTVLERFSFFMESTFLNIYGLTWIYACNALSWLYWTQVGGPDGLVMRSNLNGSAPSLVTSRIQTPNAIHVDNALQTLYVLDGVNGSLYSCQLTVAFRGNTQLVD